MNLQNTANASVSRQIRALQDQTEGTQQQVGWWAEGVTAFPKVMVKQFVLFSVPLESVSFGAKQPSGNLPE